MNGHDQHCMPPPPPFHENKSTAKIINYTLHVIFLDDLRYFSHPAVGTREYFEIAGIFLLGKKPVLQNLYGNISVWDVKVN